MVSSAVYGIENLLDQIHFVLEEHGYTVWMSHKGTFPLNYRRSNFANCLQAVNDCDLFLGIINGRYGSGRPAQGRSIVHRELIRSIRQNKPRWFLVHHDVVIARQLLRQFRFGEDGAPLPLRFKKTPVLEDIRVLEMYERAIRDEVPLERRTGNWVQTYFRHDDALRFVEAQFGDVEGVRRLLKGD